ncbi:MAG TPA: radical SAM protein [Bryobacteraceae bacterium]|nr:radical SAM protein [Bryobacteraceae bacterium]
MSSLVHLNTPSVCSVPEQLPDELLTRDTSRPVMLIGFQEQSNLGLGYLSATLQQHGYRVQVFDFEQNPKDILRAAKLSKPILIGFSLIFQFYVDRFGSLIRYLRRHGVTCHFTMGGHFPSLSYEHNFQLIPEIDSIVRFEGETTLLELVDSLSTGRSWCDLKGIAYKSGDSVVANPLRPLVPNLDDLPYPERNTIRPTMMLGRRAMPIIASRGCIRTCSFCSIHVFYRVAPGKVVRTRKPARVADEMRMLFDEQGITIFLFQDDDFPLYGPVWQRWANEFVDELYRHDLPGRVIWKINCRADAVDPVLMARMRDAGLYVVYMGLESGSEDGLATLHKQITVEQNLKAVRMLKSLDLHFEYGFMLFDPSSTFDSVRANLDFLRKIVGDGTAPGSFCRMVPYDGTPIKDELVRTGRFRGDICNPDYEFLDPRMDRFFHALNRMIHVSGWIHGMGALTPQLQYADTEIAVLENLFPPLPGLREYKHTIQELTRSANQVLFTIVEDTSYVYSDGKRNRWTPEAVRTECLAFQERLQAERDAFVSRHQEILLEALGEQPAPADAVVYA